MVRINVAASLWAIHVLPHFDGAYNHTRHKLQKRKIVGNAAPMAKNLMDYLKKHRDCEVYAHQDRAAGETVEILMNPLKPSDAIEMVLSEEGEAVSLISMVRAPLRTYPALVVPQDFYLAHRGKNTKPLYIPVKDGASLAQVRRLRTASPACLS